MILSNSLTLTQTQTQQEDPLDYASEDEGLDDDDA
jgi:hypothetical protein